MKVKANLDTVHSLLWGVAYFMLVELDQFCLGFARK